MLNVYTNSIFYRHDTGVGHPETPSRLDAALEGVKRAGLAARVLRDVPRHEDTDRIIAKVHSAEFEQELEQACRAGMRLFHSLDNPISSASFAAAREAVSTALVAAKAMMDGNRSFVIARPTPVKFGSNGASCRSLPCR